MLFYFSIYILVINCIAFLLYGLDKYKARRNRWRIPEKTLLLLALFGGTIGAWVGMKVFHHKTKHLKFTLGVPLIALLQLAALGLFLWLKYFH